MLGYVSLESKQLDHRVGVGLFLNGIHFLILYSLRRGVDNIFRERQLNTFDDY
jgi:hypothetical protein